MISLERGSTSKSAVSDLNASAFIQKAFKGMKELTQAQKSLKGLQNEIKVRKLNEINKNLQMAARRDPSSISVFRQNKIFNYIKHFFIQNVSKAPALAFLRLLIPSQPDSLIYLNNNIPLLVVRVLEREESRQKSNDWQEQIIQALKFIAEWINHMPYSIPRIFATSLVCYAQLPAVSGLEQKKKDHISQHTKLLAIDILLSLSVNNIQLCLQAGGFSLLLSSITDPSVFQRSQDILLRILYFMNEQKTRQKIWNYVDLKKIFCIFTDLDFIFVEENNKNKGNIDFCSRIQTQLSLSKQALLTLFKSWNGIILLATDHSILSTILEALRQIPKKQDSEVRKTIYSLLEELLEIGEGLIGQHIVQLQNDFRASSLLSSYIIDLLRLLMSHDLFKLLIELSGIDERTVSEPAQRLLKKLSVYMFSFLPDASNYMDFLISAGTKSGPGSSILKYSSSFVVNKIGSYVFEDTKQGRNPFLSQLEYLFNPDSFIIPLKRSSVLAVSKNLNFLGYKEIPNYRRRLLELKPIPKDHKQNFKQWNWNIIIDLLSFPDIEKEGSKPDSSDKFKQFKLFKYLLKFYSPMRGNFAEQKWSVDNLVYIKGGKLLVQNALMIPDNLALVKNPPESQFECTVSFMGELEKTLETALQSSCKSPCGYYHQFFKNLQRQLILWIGSFTLTKLGYESLICQNNFFQILYNYIKYKQCSFIIAGVIFYMDFYRDSLGKRYREDGQEKTIFLGPKTLLGKCVKEGSKSLKLMCIEVIKLLYKVEMSGFLGEGFKMLLLLCGDEKEQIWSNSILTIEELVKDKSLLTTLLSILIEYEIQNRKGFEVVKERITSAIFIRLTGLPEGYKFIEQKYPEWLETEYEKWVKPESSQMYFSNLEQLLNNCLNFSHRKSGGYKIQTKKKDWLQWAFFYKLPWLLYINEAEEVPVIVRINNQSVLLFAEFDQEEYDFRSMNTDNIIKVCLGMGGIFLDEALNPTKTKHSISINLNDNKLITLYGQQYYCSSESGVSVYFALKPQGESVQEVSESQYANRYSIKRIHLEIKLSSFFEIEELPLHLIQQITKTELGMQFLVRKKLTDHSKNVLDNPQSTSVEIRSVLWSLGYYGSDKEGFTKLSKEGVIDRVINMSMNCSTLSLRGTCRYVLNMFCHSQQGRNYLTHHHFTVNKKLLSCFPTEPNLLFTVNDSPKVHISQNDQLWKEYEQGLVPMSENENKLFESIGLLINSLSSKLAISQIKETMKSNTKITFSWPLLQNIVHLMSYFKMKQESRKTIHFIFEEFLRSNEFINETSGLINYPLSG